MIVWRDFFFGFMVGILLTIYRTRIYNHAYDWWNR